MNNKSLLKDLPKAFYQEEKILLSNNADIEQITSLETDE